MPPYLDAFEAPYQWQSRKLSQRVTRRLAIVCAAVAYRDVLAVLPSHRLLTAPVS